MSRTFKRQTSVITKVSGETLFTVAATPFASESTPVSVSGVISMASRDRHNRNDVRPTCRSINVREGHQLVLLLLEGGFEIRKRDGRTEWRLELVNICAIRAEARVPNFKVRTAHKVGGARCLPICEAVSKVAGVQNECIFAGLDEVGGDLSKETGSQRRARRGRREKRTMSQPRVPEPAMRNG